MQLSAFCMFVLQHSDREHTCHPQWEQGALRLSNGPGLPPLAVVGAFYASGAMVKPPLETGKRIPDQARFWIQAGGAMETK